ncbi:ABC transporter substrate-binding protein [Chthonobacter albigriseus]|uniref:ABC transporter substrate-binding protein n=1 Tax=Chthonobacter albigriseus TaxID=1683161 RepID=UPI0015EFAA88|nr:sugar ABC transporter substrate-binding protein [Chthonobacter albigriseus]
MTTLTHRTRGSVRAMVALGALLLSTSLTLADTIKVWHHGGRGDGERDRIQAMIDAWNKQNPDIPAELEIQPEGAYNEQVQAAALSGDLPDLLDFDGPNYANYVWSGYLLPLNDLVSKELLDDTLPSVIAQGTYPPDGKVYSLGTGDSGLSIWGSKSLLEKAGVRIPTGVADAWTMAEFEDALAKLQKVEGVKYALDIKLNYGQGEWYTYGFSPIVQSMGGDLIDRTTWKAEGTINGEAAVKALTHLQGWVKAGYVAPASEGDDAFYGKKTAALSFVGHWMWPAHSKALGNDLVLLPMPKWGDKHVTGMGSWCWGITKTSKQPENVAKLLEFFMSTENVAALSNAMGGVPGVKSAAPSVDLYKDGGPLNLYIQQLNGGLGVPRPAHPAYPTITAAFAKAVADVVDGVDPKAALDEAAKRIDQDIEDNSGYPPFGGN